MKLIHLMILILVTSVFSQQKIEVISEVEGDLLGDSTSELVRIVDYHDSLSEEFTRYIEIYNQKDSTLDLILSTTGGMRSNSGGFGADAFSELSVEDREILVSFEGGTRQRWFTTQKFKYKNGNFVLTYSSSSGLTMYEDDFESTENVYDFKTGKWKYVDDNFEGLKADSGIFNEIPTILLNDSLPLADELYLDGSGKPVDDTQ